MGRLSLVAKNAIGGLTNVNKRAVALWRAMSLKRLLKRAEVVVLSPFVTLCRPSGTIISCNKITIVRRTVLSLLTVVALGFVITIPNSNKSADANLARTKAEGITTSSLGASPKFNFLGPTPPGVEPANNGDLEMLQVKDETDSGAWGDPINSNLSHIVGFSVYFHNGVPESVAHETTVRVDLPLAEGRQLHATSYLWSAETPYITDTVVDGIGMIGPAGATINLPTLGRIEYVPNTTKLLTRKPENLSQFNVTPLPDGITTTGVGIGDINGCWQYQGYVYFQAKISNPAVLALDKEVTIPTVNPFYKLLPHQPDVPTINLGDVVVYRLSVRNNGGSTASPVTIKDILPLEMTNTYIRNSLQVWDSQGHSTRIDESHNTLFTSAGLPLPDMAPGNAGVVFVTFQAQLPTGFTVAGLHTLVNHAYVYLGGVEQAHDEAVVEVFMPQTGIIVTKNVIDANGNVLINPTFNLNETIRYRITITNTGNVPVNSINVLDNLPQVVRYTGPTYRDGAPQPDTIYTSGIGITTLGVGQATRIEFSGVVYGCPPAGLTSFTNTATVRATGIPEMIATATATVNAGAPAIPRVFN